MNPLFFKHSWNFYTYDNKFVNNVWSVQISIYWLEAGTGVVQWTRGDDTVLAGAGRWHRSTAGHLDRTYPAHIGMLSLIYYPTFNTLLLGDIISLSLSHMVGEICNGQSVTSQSRNSPGYLQKRAGQRKFIWRTPRGKLYYF